MGAGAVRLLHARFGLNPVLSAPLAFALTEMAVPSVFTGYIGTTV